MSATYTEPLKSRTMNIRLKGIEWLYSIDWGTTLISSDFPEYKGHPIVVVSDVTSTESDEIVERKGQTGAIWIYPQMDFGTVVLT